MAEYEEMVEAHDLLSRVADMTDEEIEHLPKLYQELAEKYRDMARELSIS